MKIEIFKSMWKSFLILTNLFFPESAISCKEKNIEIIDVYDIKKVHKYFNNVNKKTLVFFDIDSTIIMPDDDDLIRNSIKLYKETYQKLIRDLSDIEKSIFLHILVINYPSRFVDKNIIPEIETLQKLKAQVMGLTAAKFGYINKTFFPDFRFDQLKKMGIEFKSTYPLQKKFQLSDPSLKSDAGIDRGIIYTGHIQKKGDFIPQILKSIDFSPDYIIMIDDRRENIEYFGAKLSEYSPSIRFLGIHYRKIETIYPKKPDKKRFIQKISCIVNETKISSFHAE